MRTITDIEEEAGRINDRMMAIYDELRAEPSRAAELAEELAKLLHRAKVISCSLKIFQETSAQLLNEPCHGPH